MLEQYTVEGYVLAFHFFLIIRNHSTVLSYMFFAFEKLLLKYQIKQDYDIQFHTFMTGTAKIVAV